MIFAYNFVPSVFFSLASFSLFKSSFDYFSSYFFLESAMWMVEPSGIPCNWDRVRFHSPSRVAIVCILA